MGTSLGVDPELERGTRAQGRQHYHGRNRRLERKVTLDAVGVGVSQLLPVLVLCLLSEPGGVILLEQPELHLHPALQQRLADFLIAVARSGRQLIVETHSEYIVSRLRRRIAEDTTEEDDLLAMSKIVFAERDRQTGLTTYREVEFSLTGPSRSGRRGSSTKPPKRSGRSSGAASESWPRGLLTSLELSTPGTHLPVM